GIALVVENHRYALVRGLEHGLGLGNATQQADGEDFLDVLDTEHFALGHALGVVAGQQQVLLDRLLAVFGAPRFAGQQAEHAVGVAYRRDFRVGHHDGLVGAVHGQVRTFLDAGRRVADDVFAGLRRFVVDLHDACVGQCTLGAGLAGGQHVQVLQALVLDRRVGQGGVAIDDVDEVIHHAALAAHDQVQSTQADVEVDDGGLVSAQGAAGTDGGAGSGLADATLARSDREDLGQGDSP